MGADGHTASLFPHSEALREQLRLVRMNQAHGVTPAQRVTMTYPLLNSARFIAVMVTGRSKAEALRKVADASLTATLRSIRGIVPTSGELRWYLDAEACGA